MGGPDEPLPDGRPGEEPLPDGRLRDEPLPDDRLTGVALPEGVDPADLRAALRRAGAVFAYVHGSRVSGLHHQWSDLDVAAWFGRVVGAWEIRVPPGVDLMVLDTAGLELAGRVAQHGVLLLDDDPPVRVRWQADRSKRYLDEAHRRAQLVQTVLGGG